MWIGVLKVAAFAVLVQWLVIPHVFPEYGGMGAPTKPVRGSTVLVTGASLGIGRSLVEEYAREGAADIVMAARSVDKMNAIRDRIYADGIASKESTRIHVLKADLSTKENSEKCVEEALMALPEGRGLDFLVLNHITNSRFGTWLKDNAALPGGHAFVPEMFATNTFSYIWMATKAMDTLKKTDGQIMVVSSLAGWIGPPKCAVYSATKHALQGFFDSLRIELKMMGLNNVGITVAALGSHETEGAAEVKSHVSDMVVWEPAVTAARAMITAASYRKREIYQPHLIVYPMLAMRPFFPSFIDFCLSLAVKI